MTALEAVTITCPSCGFVTASEPVPAGALTCPGCHARIEIAAFPALFRPSGRHAHEVVVADESTCYFHVDRVAAFACARCGRFLCPLCRIEWTGEDLCSACLQASSTGAERNKLASSRFHFDSLALALSTVLVLTGFLSVLTAPVALGFALFTFRKECSVAPRTRIRFLLAILFSTATIAGWIVFFIYAFRRNSTGR